MGKTVVFWSPKKGHSGATACVCAMAAALATGREARQVAVAHTSLSSWELEERLDYRMEERQGGLYERTGLSALMLRFKREELREETIRHCGILLPGSLLDLFPGGGRSMAALQEQEKTELMLALLLEKLPMAYDMALIDLESGSSVLSFESMKRADMTVIVLPQERNVWKRFFDKEFQKLEARKVFFLLGGMLEDAKYGVGEFLRIAGGAAKKERVGIVPRNAEYLEAMTDGRVIEFFLKNECGRRRETNAAFMEQTRRAAHRLCEYTDGTGGKKKIFLSGTLQGSKEYVE